MTAPELPRLLKHRRPMVVAIHLLLIVLSYSLAFGLRFDFNLPAEERARLFETVLIIVGLRLASFYDYKIFEGLWRYVSLRDLAAILKATTVSSIAFVAFVFLVFGPGYGLPRSVFVLDWVLCLGLVAGIRIAIRFFREMVARPQAGSSRALIIGAGEGADALLRSIRSERLNYDVIGLIDDAPAKRHVSIRGVPVVGRIDEIPELVKKNDIQTLLVAVPSASLEEKRHILQQCRLAGVPVRSVPSLEELIEKRARIGELDEIDPEVLLSREPIKLDLDAMREGLEGKRIVVTGAGGSIGMELCRQLAPFNPETIILFERSESNLFLAHTELKSRFPDLKAVPVVGDVTDRHQIRQVFETYSPHCVYHAAAYKHVPLMEDHPLEAIENNVNGTLVPAEAAREAGVERFILISTDKAVAPSNVMGMTKRVAEGVALTFKEGPGIFAAVRFGNVLGSVGSVVPLFQGQLTRGGPLTVTDPDATRYFMLLSEASQLVLQAGIMAESGDIFFLDMGQPIRIGGLAEDMIRLAGLRPGDDVPVNTVGLRHGETLTEELFSHLEELATSSHERIVRVKKKTFDQEAFEADLQELRVATAGRNTEKAVAALKRIAENY